MSRSCSIGDAMARQPSRQEYGSPQQFPMSGKSILDCASVEELFWAIINQVSDRATKRGCLVSIVAQPGWKCDEAAVDALLRWNNKEIAQADRIIWRKYSVRMKSTGLKEGRAHWHFGRRKGVSAKKGSEYD